MTETTQIAKREAAGQVLERVMVAGDLSGLTPAQRSAYYSEVCRSLGLNPYTKPFAYLKLNGKLVLYALRDCADQLRKINSVSIEIVDRKLIDGLLSVHVRARTADRQDEDFGVVALGDARGEAAANLIMKAVTKAKRRVTLSICGLGMLDETEVATIPGAQMIQEEASASCNGKVKATMGPAELLRHLEDEFSACGDLEVLQETWDAYAEQINRLTRSHRAIAEAHMQRRSAEIERASKERAA